MSEANKAIFRRIVIGTCIPLMLLVLLVSASAYAKGVTAAALQRAGWDCTAPIAGNVHCTPPGLPTLGDLIQGIAAPATLVLTNFSSDGQALVGTELLIRADVYTGQLCNTDPIGGPPGAGVGPYTFLGIGPGYYACHHFDSQF